VVVSPDVSLPVSSFIVVRLPLHFIWSTPHEVAESEAYRTREPSVHIYTVVYCPVDAVESMVEEGIKFFHTSTLVAGLHLIQRINVLIPRLDTGVSGDTRLDEAASG